MNNFSFLAFFYVLAMHTSLFSSSLFDIDFIQPENPDFYSPYDIHETKNPSRDEFFPPQMLTNLEDLAQDFVLELKQIEIPGFPNSFNPSITRWQGKLLLIFRIRNSKTQTTNQMGLVWLNDNFELDGHPYVLKIPPSPSTTIAKEQDPRLMTIGDRLFMVYSNMIPGMTVRETRRVFIAEIHFENDVFFTDVPQCLCSFDIERELRWEKNWVPFDYQGELLLAYSITPHHILQMVESGKCATLASSLGLIDWGWGYLRGGTPALLDKENGQYLAFFHSSIHMPTVHSNGKKMAHYFMGAYTFSSEPPFEITKMSPEPIIGKNFYSSPQYKTWKPLRVVFPGGIIINEDFVWVLYGRQDFEIWVAKLDKKQLLNSLIPISTLIKS